jgi:hypothetical protein
MFLGGCMTLLSCRPEQRSTAATGETPVIRIFLFAECVREPSTFRVRLLGLAFHDFPAAAERFVEGDEIFGDKAVAEHHLVLRGIEAALGIKDA